MNEDIVRLQKEVKVFKLMKYRDGYNDGVQGKSPRYYLDVGSLHVDQGMMKVLASHTPSMPDASTTTTIIETSQDTPINAAPAEGQFAETRQDSEADPVSGATEALHPDFVSV